MEQECTRECTPALYQCKGLLEYTQERQRKQINRCDLLIAKRSIAIPINTNKVYIYRYIQYK